MLSGMGLPEIVIIVIIVVVLFGPALLTFWLGYVIGRNRSTAATTEAETATDEEQEL